MSSQFKNVHVPNAEVARMIVDSAGVTLTGDLMNAPDKLMLVAAHQFLLPYQPCASSAQFPTGDCMGDCPFNGYVVHREIYDFLGIPVIDHSIPYPGF